jgi:sugar lactone lactonase YvrE
MKKLYFLLIFYGLYISLKAQSVSSITNGSFTDGIAIDQQGNLYCSDWGGNRIYKYDTAGTVSVFKAGFSNPNGLCVSDSGYLYVCDHTANTIYKLDLSGSFLDTFPSFSNPADIKQIPGSNDFLVTEYNSRRIKRLHANGTVSVFFQGVPLNGPVGITFIDTTVFIGNYNDRRILRFNNGSFQQVVQIPSAGGPFPYLGFISAMNGKIYATQLSANRIYEIDPINNTTLTYAGTGTFGSSNGPVSSATFSYPNGIYADSISNQIFVSDYSSKNLRIINNNSVGINEVFHPSDALIKLYPNPSHSSITIELNDPSIQKVSITIYDSKGQTMNKKDLSVKQGKIFVPLTQQNLPPGSYIIQVVNKATIASRTFVVE